MNEERVACHEASVSINAIILSGSVKMFIICILLRSGISPFHIMGWFLLLRMVTLGHLVQFIHAEVTTRQ
jgi:hypothetical protein